MLDSLGSGPSGSRTGSAPASPDPKAWVEDAGLSVDVVGGVGFPAERLCCESWAGDLDEIAGPEVGVVVDMKTGVGDAEYGISIMGTVMVETPGEAEATETAAVSKLHRTPACRHREHEGLTRSQRRLKCRQRSHVLTSRCCGMSALSKGGPLREASQPGGVSELVFRKRRKAEPDKRRKG